MGAPGLDFVTVWSLPDASWAVGRSWEPLGRFLGASWTALGPLLGALGCLLAAASCPRGPRTRFQRVLGVSREGLGGPKAVFFDVFSYISFDVVPLVDVLRDAFQPRAIITNTFQQWLLGSSLLLLVSHPRF